MARKAAIAGSQKTDSADSGFVVADNKGSQYFVHQHSVEAAAGDAQQTDEEQLLYSAAFSGLNSGNLAPLATYLRSQYPLHPALARVLADCIDHPEAFWKVYCKRARTVSGTFSDAVWRKQRIATIGYFIENALPTAGKMESAVAAAIAVEEFDLGSEAAVFALWKKYLRYKEDGHIQNGFWMGSLGASGAKSIRGDG